MKKTVTTDYVVSELKSMASLTETIRIHRKTLDDLHDVCDTYSINSEQIIEQLFFFEESLNALIQKYRMVFSWFAYLTPTEEQILIEHYLKGNSYATISINLNYTERTIYMFRKNALNKIVKKLSTEMENSEKGTT